MNPRTFAALLAVTLLALRSVSAESLNERDFKQLRADRDKAAAAAIDPINRRYKDELEKIFRRATQAAELDLARKIQAELQVVGGAGAAKAPSDPLADSAPSGAPVDKSDLRKLFENSEWLMFNGPTAKTSNGAMVFERNGKMIASGIGDAGYYTFEAPDLLKIYGRDPKRYPKEPFRTLRVNMDEKTASQDLSLSTREGKCFLRYNGPAKAAK